MKAFGFDPSINDSAWAIVDGEGQVTCGLIRNGYKEKARKLDHWQKLASLISMLEEGLNAIVLSCPDMHFDVWVCEGQYASRRGNQEHNIRLGWVSAIAYAFGLPLSSKRMIAVPTKWTRGVPKEVRHEELLKKVVPEDEWIWHGDPAPKSLMHNIYDAVGLAVWGLENKDEA